MMPDNLNRCHRFLHHQEKEWVCTGYSAWLTQPGALALDLVNPTVGFLHNTAFFIHSLFLSNNSGVFPLSFYHFRAVWQPSMSPRLSSWITIIKKNPSLCTYKVIFPVILLHLFILNFICHSYHPTSGVMKSSCNSAKGFRLKYHKDHCNITSKMRERLNKPSAMISVLGILEVGSCI